MASMFTTVDPCVLTRLYIRTAKLTADLGARCSAELGTVPVEVRRATAPDAEKLRCFWNVAAHVDRHGGGIVFGWSIHEWPHLFWEAQHHAVWRSSDEELVDITPPAAPGGKITLFVEDEASAFDLDSGFDGPQDDRRFPLVRWPELRSYSEAGINIRHRKNALASEDYASDRMLSNFISVERSAKEAMLIKLANSLADDMPCFCGSDQLFAECCQSFFR